MTVLIVILLHFNQKDRWNDSAEKAYIYLMTCSSANVCAIFIISLAFKIAQKVAKKRSSKGKVGDYPKYESGRMVITRTNISESRFERFRHSMTCADAVQLRT